VLEEARSFKRCRRYLCEALVRVDALCALPVVLLHRRVSFTVTVTL
jgi:hypothetical protein